jgi:hypothetical protein
MAAFVSGTRVAPRTAMATAHQLGMPVRTGRDLTGKPTLFINNVRHVGAHDARVTRRLAEIRQIRN